MAKVKAMIFTIGLVMLSLIILSLAVLIFNTFQKAELTMSNIGALDRIYELDTSIQNVLKNLFKSSWIDLEVDNELNLVSFKERIPSNNTVFNLTLTNFKNFTESNFDYVNLDLDNVAKELPLIITPHNIGYKHLNFGERIIEITPASINFDKYEIFLDFNENIVSCPVEYSEETDFDTYIQASSPAMECSLRKIEPDIENKVQTEEGFVYLRADSDGSLVIIANDTIAWVETKIWLNPLTDINVGYPDGIININLPEIGVSKTSSVRIR